MNRRDRILPPPFSNRHIVDLAESLGEETIRCLSLPPLGFPPELFHVSFDTAYNEIIYPEYNIDLVEDMDLGRDAEGNKVLGLFDAAKNCAFIDVSLRSDPRRTFTCWHEVGGHGVLQGAWLRQELSRLGTSGCVETTEASLSFATTEVLERQANLFAAHAAAPTRFLRYAVKEFFRITRPIRYIGPRTYTLDYRGACRWLRIESFSHLCQTVAQAVQWRFDYLSLEALGYRIQKLPDIVLDLSNRPFELRRTARPSSPFSKTASAAVA